MLPAWPLEIFRLYVTSCEEDTQFDRNFRFRGKFPLKKKKGKMEKKKKRRREEEEEKKRRRRIRKKKKK